MRTPCRGYIALVSGTATYGKADETKSTSDHCVDPATRTLPDHYPWEWLPVMTSPGEPSTNLQYKQCIYLGADWRCSLNNHQWKSSTLDCPVPQLLMRSGSQVDCLMLSFHCLIAKRLASLEEESFSAEQFIGQPICGCNILPILSDLYAYLFICLEARLCYDFTSNACIIFFNWFI